MHLVTHAYFKSFCEIFGTPYTETKNFEAFVNYCVYSRYSADKIEIADLVYEGEDPGIDGAFVFFDDRLVGSAEEAAEIFSMPRKEYNVSVVITQAKSSTSWSKKEIDSFIAYVIDILSPDTAQPHAEHLAEFKLIFEKIFENIGKVKGGLPALHVYFLTAAGDTDAVEINAAFVSGLSNLEKMHYSNDVQFFKGHRDYIHELWQAAEGPVEARLPTVGYAPFPAAPNINNAYVATVRAKHFIERVLKNEDGTVRKKLFEENVRDFLGVDVDVNSEIGKTLKEYNRKARFGLMNNGVTIVASSVRPAGQEIYIRDFQIVNGCQTSNVLMSFEDYVDENVSLMVKLIEASEPAIIDDIVRATNRQSKVEDAQFVSTLEVLRKIESYFSARGAGEANRLYFERRRGQYGPESVAPVRIFDVRETARCFAAIEMMRPDLASRYPNRLTGELLNQVFLTNQSEETYYVACFAHYRLRMLISNKKFDGRYSKLRWHIMCAVSKFCRIKYKEMGFKSKDEAIYSLFSANDGQWFERLNNIISFAIPDPNISRDLLKSPPLTSSILSNVEKLLTPAKLQS